MAVEKARAKMTEYTDKNSSNAMLSIEFILRNSRSDPLDDVLGGDDVSPLAIFVIGFLVWLMTRDGCVGFSMVETAIMLPSVRCPPTFPRNDS